MILLANSLSGLVAGSGGETPRTPDTKKHGRRAKNSSLSLDVQIDSYHLSGAGSPNRIAVEVGLVPVCTGPGPFILRAALSAIDENKGKHEIYDRISLQWTSEMPLHSVPGDPAAVTFTQAIPISLKVIYPNDVTLDMDFSLGEKP